MSCPPNAGSLGFPRLSADAAASRQTQPYPSSAGKLNCAGAAGNMTLSETPQVWRGGHAPSPQSVDSPGTTRYNPRAFIRAADPRPPDGS
jgi:hypothetical protein